jgi:hypothetical protein
MASARTSTHGRRHAEPRRRRGLRVAIGAALVAVIGVTTALVGATLPAEASVLGGATPKVATDSDRMAVELGMRFSSAKGGTVNGVRYYRGPSNAGPHTGSLWDASGKRLATVTFSNETKSGWQTAYFATPVKVTAGKGYVASYLAPKGGYSDDTHYFDKAKTVGDLKVPAGAGVYAYGPKGGYPTDNWFNSNYYVDVLFTPSVGSPSPSGSPTTTPTSTPTPTKSPTSTPTPTKTPTPTQTPSGPATGDGSGNSALSLPKIPWEGGSDYWKKFSKPNAAGWSDPSFFPIVVWYDGISSDAEVNYDKSLGLNTYIGMDAATPYSLFGDNDVYWIGGKLNSSFNDSSKNWVGDFLDDEVDGRFTPAEGRAYLQQIVDNLGNDGRFKYANFTQMVMATDMKAADSQAFVNKFTDAVSLDMYWYTIPYCSQTPYRDVYLTPIDQANCRTSSSYGKTMQSLRKQDAADGKLQPLWQFVENLNGGPGPSAPAVYITPGQLEGAVMNSVINEARGIVYFNQSFSGNCQSSNVFRQSQVNKNFCGAAQVAAAKEVNNRIKDLATVINTQSYQWSFGSGLNTMLKAKDGYAYVFSMVDGSSKPGSRTFQLPAGVSGKSVQVLYENRTLPVSSSGTFSDSFANESTYHIYKVALG